jgi:hypothetical protein
MKTIDNIPPVGVIYYLRTAKPILDETYEPVSFENWKMLRELEPTKFQLTYDEYVQSKKGQHEVMIESRRNAQHELVSIAYSLDERDIENTQTRIRAVVESDDFVEWLGDEEVNNIIQEILEYGI